MVHHINGFSFCTFTDYMKTSLVQSINIFKKFLDGLDKENAERRRKQSEKEGGKMFNGNNLLTWQSTKIYCMGKI